MEEISCESTFVQLINKHAMIFFMNNCLEIKTKTTVSIGLLCRQTQTTFSICVNGSKRREGKHATREKRGKTQVRLGWFSFIMIGCINSADFRSGCRNGSHRQQLFSELHSPERSHNTNYKQRACPDWLGMFPNT